MKLTFSILLIFACNTFLAQNLVLNPDFELFQCKPWYISSVENCSDWSSPTLSSPDYFNPGCAKHAEKSTQYWGFQKPASGKSFAGIIAYDYRRNDPNNVGAEYLQGKLSQPLVAGEEYFVEFHVSLAECSRISLQQLGIHFSTHAIHQKTNGLLKLEPQFASSVDLADTASWIKVSGKYVATGNEAYFVIGCFDQGKKIRFDNVKPSLQITESRDYTYYFIDAVSVKPVNPMAVAVSDLTKPQTGEPVISAPTVTALEVGKSVILKNISFESSSFKLKPGSFAELDSLAQVMKQNPRMEIVISGHTDNTGDAKQNLRLSQQRAEATAKYLIGKKINPKRIRFEGLGDSRPIATNQTEEGKRQNRRVEILVTKK